MYIAYPAITPLLSITSRNSEVRDLTFVDTSESFSNWDTILRQQGIVLENTGMKHSTESEMSCGIRMVVEMFPRNVLKSSQ